MTPAVIVTTYNRADALAAVLDGYLAQTAADFELIVADDGSTDDTLENASRMAGVVVASHNVTTSFAGSRAASSCSSEIKVESFTKNPASGDAKSLKIKRLRGEIPAATTCKKMDPAPPGEKPGA